MKVILDGKEMTIEPGDKTIVDLADRAKIALPAPCYRTKRIKGCCNGCVVEIDGEQKFACVTKPEDGMEIIITRSDLKNIRKTRLQEYAAMIQSSGRSSCQCSCGCSDNNDNTCC